MFANHTSTITNASDRIAAERNARPSVATVNVPLLLQQCHESVSTHWPHLNQEP